MDELIPSYPNAVFYPIGGPVAVNGYPRQMSYALTPDRPSKVADRYAAVWTSQGYRVDRKNVGEELWVTATSPSEPTVRTIGAVARDGGSMIVASVSSMDAEEPPSRAPLPSGCAAMSTSRAKDQGGITDFVQMTCAIRLVELLTFYDRRLEGLERSARASDEAFFVRYSDEQQVVTLTAHEEKVGEVQALLTWSTP